MEQWKYKLVIAQIDPSKNPVENNAILHQKILPSERRGWIAYRLCGNDENNLVVMRRRNKK